MTKELFNIQAVFDNIGEIMKAVGARFIATFEQSGIKKFCLVKESKKKHKKGKRKK